MEDDDLICGEVNLGVPYRKIDSIEFALKGHSKTNNQTVFEVEFECKYEGLNKADKPAKIQRKFADFQWLAASIKSQYTNFLIVPYLEAFEKGYAKSLINLVSAKTTPSNSKENKDISPADKYERIVVGRFIKILSQISLKYMYQKLGEPKNPLFIFIQSDSNYKFYRSLYDQQNTPQESIFSGYLHTVLEYIPTFTKKKSVELYGMGPTQQGVEKLYNKGSQLIERLKAYRSQLQKTYENFIRKQHREQLREKISKVDTFLCRLSQNLRYAHLILSQINENMEKYIVQTEKPEKQVQKYISKIIHEYIAFVERERSQINGSIHNIAREFIEENVKEQQRVKIDIAEIYPNYFKIPQ